jgi:hypothetical protein
MNKIKINVISEFDKNSELEITDFINNLKDSFENVVLIYFELLPIENNKFYKYEYKVKFYHDLFLII